MTQLGHFEYVIPKIQCVLSIAVIHDPTRFRENPLNCFRLILFTEKTDKNKGTDGPWQNIAFVTITPPTTHTAEQQYSTIHWAEAVVGLV